MRRYRLYHIGSKFGNDAFVRIRFWQTNKIANPMMKMIFAPIKIPTATILTLSRVDRSFMNLTRMNRYDSRQYRSLKLQYYRCSIGILSNPPYSDTRPFFLSLKNSFWWSKSSNGFEVVSKRFMNSLKFGISLKSTFWLVHSQVGLSG